MLRALALPDVHFGWIWRRKRPPPDELAAEVRGNVLDRDRARVQVALEAVELRHEIPVELGLEVAQRGLGRLAIDGLSRWVSRPSACGWSRARRGAPCRRLAATTSNRRWMSARAWRSRSTSTGLERPIADRGHQGREVLMMAIFSAWPSGITRSDRVDLGDRRQGLEGALLLRAARPVWWPREGVEAGAAGAGEDAPLPDHRFRPLGLQVEQVVVEGDRGQRPEGEHRRDPPMRRARSGVAREPVEEGHVNAARAAGRAGSGAAGAPSGGGRRA